MRRMFLTARGGARAWVPYKRAPSNALHANALAASGTGGRVGRQVSLWRGCTGAFGSRRGALVP